MVLPMMCTLTNNCLSLVAQACVRMEAVSLSRRDRVSSKVFYVSQHCTKYLQAFASLIAAYLVSMKVNRARIVGMGTMLSGITAAGVALSFRYGYMMVWRAIDGLAPALVVPAVQSVIAGARLQLSHENAVARSTILISY